jgi:hypothetical protein
LLNLVIIIIIIIIIAAVGVPHKSYLYIPIIAKYHDCRANLKSVSPINLLVQIELCCNFLIGVRFDRVTR